MRHLEMCDCWRARRILCSEDWIALCACVCASASQVRNATVSDLLLNFTELFPTGSYLLFYCLTGRNINTIAIIRPQWPLFSTLWWTKLTFLSVTCWTLVLLMFLMTLIHLALFHIQCNVPTMGGGDGYWKWLHIVWLSFCILLIGIFSLKSHTRPRSALYITEPSIPTVGGKSYGLATDAFL